MVGEQPCTVQRIETPRLMLRWFAAEDLEAFYVLGTEPQVIRYVGNTPFASLAAAHETLAAAPLASVALLVCGRKPAG